MSTVAWKEGKEIQKTKLIYFDQLIELEVTGIEFRVFMECECGVVNLFHTWDINIGENYCHHCGKELEELLLCQF